MHSGTADCCLTTAMDSAIEKSVWHSSNDFITLNDETTTTMLTLSC